MCVFFSFPKLIPTLDIDRFNGEENFDRSWDEYKMGFGDVKNEFWIGNENLHLFTKQGSSQIPRLLL